MTIMPPSPPLSAIAEEHGAALVAAATAAAGLLPTATSLSAGDPAPGALTSAAGFAGGAIADFEGGVSGAIAVLVGQDLVDALASSPLGSLDLAGAAQPALDAAAEALGGRVGAARAVDLVTLVSELGHPFTVVPLVGNGAAAALMVNDDSIEGGARAVAAASAMSANLSGVELQAQAPQAGAPIARGLEMLHGVILDVTVELGRTKMSVRDLLALTPGTVLELDRAAGSPADLLVNGRLIARGEVVVVDEDFGLRVTEIVDDPTAI